MEGLTAPVAHADFALLLSEAFLTYGGREIKSTAAPTASDHLHIFHDDSARSRGQQEVADKGAGAFDRLRFEHGHVAAGEIFAKRNEVRHFECDMVQSSGALVEAFQRTPVRNHEF